MAGGVVGVASDVEVAGVVRSMVGGAECDQVVRVCFAADFPMDEVVNLEVVGSVAARGLAAAGSLFDEAADPLGDDAVVSTDVGWGAVGF